jgi:hypothetical protein
VVKTPLGVNGCLKASYFKYFINHKKTRFLLNEFNDSSEYDSDENHKSNGQTSNENSGNEISNDAIVRNQRAEK